MNDDRLDELLSAAIKPMTPAALRETAMLVDASMPAQLREGRPVRSRWFVPMLVGGSLALTAGAGVAVVEMSHWAGVSMPLENARNTTPIPVNWTTDDGHSETCRAWIELRNPGPGDRAALDEAIEARDWAGFGQHLYDAGKPEPFDPDGERRVADQLSPFLQKFAREVVPGVLWFSEPGDTVGVDAHGMTCVPADL
ncbi:MULTISPECIES: hypothetical protein [unclassified Cryobacterium]|uniref:hypothetical protein n=1 Tax=unclassified Cryobacterium TaxID=2649013 RepID=UPI001445C088|nr:MULTISPECIES: hypothetical protein [unclassified Cryobacterium]